MPQLNLSLLSQDLYLKVQKSIEIIKEAFRRYPDQLALSFNGGKDCTVLLHLTLYVSSNSSTKFQTIHFEHEDMFQEVIKFVNDCNQLYNLQIHSTKQSFKEGLTYFIQEYNIKGILMGTRKSDPKAGFYYLEIFSFVVFNVPNISNKQTF